MSFKDKTLECSDCGKEFTFSADEQELFQSRGYTNEPKRCTECREARKSSRYGNGGNSYGNNGNSRYGIAPPARCSPLFVRTVARKQKYRLSLVKADQYTAEIATTRSD